MSFLQMLDVAIGLIFIYLLISLICSAINEIIEAFLKKRAKDLEKGITELLGNSPGLIASLYNHPLIYGLYKGGYRSGGRNLPSYIPSQNFALALLDTICPGGAAVPTEASKAEAAAIADPSADAARPTTAVARATAATAAVPFNNLRNAVAVYPIPFVRNALLPLIDSAGDDLNKIRTNIEFWYNGSMDRVSGWYKRWVQVVLLVIGVIIAAALNADTIALYKSLVNDPPLRNSIVTASQEYAKSFDPRDTIVANVRLREALQQLHEVRVPLGWDWEKGQRNYPLAYPSGTGWTLLGNWLLKIAGWFATGLAVSLGAPFWFDTLNKVMVIRSTVKPTEKSPNEGSEDRRK